MVKEPECVILLLYFPIVYNIFYIMGIVFLIFIGYPEDHTVYDGVILMKDESPFWQKALKKFTELFKTNVNSKGCERRRGITAMLPDLVQEISDGRGLNELLATITAIEMRQKDHLNGYNYRYGYYYHEETDKSKAAESNFGKVIKICDLITQYSAVTVSC